MPIADALRNEAGQYDSFGLPAKAARDAVAHSRTAAKRSPLAKACDSRGKERELGDLPRRARSWNEIERAMNRARDLRSKHCAALLAAGFGRLWRAAVVRRAFPSARTKAAVCALMLAGPVALAGFALPLRAALAQEKIAVATRATGTDTATDQARLAELGIDAAAIEQCEDVAALWRAVRELVLTQRISEPMQQRILRRAWLVDPEVRAGSLVESEAN
jgi:hypothetical protein